MSGLSHSPEPAVPVGKEPQENEAYSIPHDFEYFRRLILENAKDTFWYNNEEPSYRDELRRADYGLLMSHLEMYKETVSDDYPGYADFDFLQGYVRKLYQSLYSDAPLASVFETPEIQEQFFLLMERYLYNGFGRKVEELIAQYRRLIPEPSKKPPILTDDEIEGLIGTFDENGKRIK